ncbi:DUF1289 domain-containing protein [Stutzerimonas tarimensis]|uniref:DUF1289 domain-containing protein n=1 Tax=Stutzerimonas tarimensis TaxID=1507735 RepID=A0ABV7T1I9_9GAMM
MSDPDKAVRSPCVSLCALDDDDICVGCQRTAAEITRWGRMSNDERRQVLLRCHERARERGQLFG